MTWRFGNYDAATGIRKDYRHDGEGGIEVRISGEVDAALDRNKAMYNHNDGYSQSRELRRVAHIPDIVALKWLNEEGWDYRDPANNDRLWRKLNDPDYLYLRTAEGHLGYSNGVIR